MTPLQITSLHITSLCVASLSCVIEDVAARLPISVAQKHIGVGSVVAVRIITEDIS
jgi:hypothetical protein